MSTNLRRRRRVQRRGSATIELAVCLPMLFVLVFGVIEVGRALEVFQVLTTAVREGARFGATDKQGFIPDGETTNDKIVADVTNYLEASGIPTGLADVEILSVPDDGGTPVPFNFEDPNNHLKNFQVKVSIPYSSVSQCPQQVLAYFVPTEIIVAQATFRNYHK
ncbi:MAG: TadE family protein [Pirellulales bacterium]